MKTLRRWWACGLLLLMGAVSAHGTKEYADLSAGSTTGSATWEVETQIFSWTASSYAYMVIPGLSGDLSGCELEVKVGDCSSDCRIDVEFDKNIVPIVSGSWDNISRGAIAIPVNDAETTYVLNLNDKYSVDELKHVESVRINTNSAEGSVVLKSVCLTRPFELTFNEKGEAYVYPSDFRTGGDVTIDELTGEVTCTGTGTLSVKFGDVDFSWATAFLPSVDYRSEGYSDICGTAQIKKTNGEVVNTWYSSKYGITYTDDNRAASESIASITWNFDKAGMMKFNHLLVTKAVVTAFAGIPLDKSHFHVWTASTDGEITSASPHLENYLCMVREAGSTVWGDGNVSHLQYADLTGYDKLIFKATPGATLRVLLNRLVDQGPVIERFPVADEYGYAVLDLTEFEFAHLNAVKLPYNGLSVTVDEIMVASDGVDYYLLGEGDIQTTAEAALADTDAFVFDATGLTSSNHAILSAANPNSLFVAKDASVLSGTRNVLVKDGEAYTCDGLTLDASRPFHTPYAFTAAKATVKKAVSSAGFATFVLPYAAAVPQGCEAYALTGADEATGKLTYVPVSMLEADSPVLLSNEGEYSFDAENVAVEATSATVRNGVLVGTYATSKAPAGSYVLQNKNSVVAFYRVQNENAQSVQPFTAYLEMPAMVGVNALMLDFSSIGVEKTEAEGRRTVVSEVYDLQGRKADTSARGLHIVRMSDGSVKKVLMK